MDYDYSDYEREFIARADKILPAFAATGPTVKALARAGAEAMEVARVESVNRQADALAAASALGAPPPTGRG